LGFFFQRAGAKAVSGAIVEFQCGTGRSLVSGGVHGRQGLQRKGGGGSPFNLERPPVLLLTENTGCWTVARTVNVELERRGLRGGGL